MNVDLSILLKSRKLTILFTCLLLLLFVVYTKLIPKWTHNVFALSSVTLMLDSHVGPEHQLTQLDLLDNIHGTWAKWNQGVSNSGNPQHWISVVTRLLEKRSFIVVKSSQMFAKQIRNAQNSRPKEEGHEASTLVDQIYLNQPDHIGAYDLNETLGASDRSGSAVLDIKPAYDLDFKSENGLHLIGFDLSTAALMLGSSRLPVIYYWTSSDVLTDEDRVVICGENGDWILYCYKDRLWVVGTTRNLFTNGTFELAPERESLPYGYKQTYPDSSATLSTEVESSEGPSSTIVCMESATPTRTSLSTTSALLNGSEKVVLATRARFNYSIKPRLGLFWLSPDQQAYTFAQQLPHGSGEWMRIAAVLEAPYEAEETQLRFLYTDSVGELCIDYILLIPLIVPDLGAR